jgi:hypothetical protein
MRDITEYQAFPSRSLAANIAGAMRAQFSANSGLVVELSLVDDWRLFGIALFRLQMGTPYKAWASSQQQWFGRINSMTW